MLSVAESPTPAALMPIDSPAERRPEAGWAVAVGGDERLAGHQHNHLQPATHPAAPSHPPPFTRPPASPSHPPTHLHTPTHPSACARPPARPTHSPSHPTHPSSCARQQGPPAPGGTPSRPARPAAAPAQTHCCWTCCSAGRPSHTGSVGRRHQGAGRAPAPARAYRGSSHSGLGCCTARQSAARPPAAYSHPSPAPCNQHKHATGRPGKSPSSHR